MRLVSPWTYLSLTDFKAQGNDRDLSSYTDAQLTDMLVRASAKVNGILNRNYLPEELVDTYEGDGTNTMMLANNPIIYVKNVELIMPGFAPFTLPIGSLYIDYARGSVKSWTPMIWRTFGVSAVFPRDNLPIVITYAYGYGYPIGPPSYTLIPGAYGSVPPSPVNVAVTTRTQSGESLSGPPQVITTTSGGFTVSITPTPGAYVYRVYLSQGPNTTLLADAPAGSLTFAVQDATPFAQGQRITLGFGTTAETLVVDSADTIGNTFTTTTQSLRDHAAGDALVAEMFLYGESAATNYGQALMPVTVSSLAPSILGIIHPPVADTSAWPLPNEFIEATRVLVFDILNEQNNLANRGVSLVVEGDKRTAWRSTEGTNDKGVPLAVQQATDLLAGFAFGGVY